MRTLSAALTTAQQAEARTPYVKFKLYSADLATTYDYSSRVLELEHTENMYSEFATVVLRNDDLGVVADLRGYWVQIGYGLYTGNTVAEPNGDGAGNEYSYSPRLWVKSQQETSAPGRLVTVLVLEGAWGLLTELLQLLYGVPPYYSEIIPGSTDTIYEMLDTFLVQAGFSLDAIGDQSDGIIDVEQPRFFINNPATFSAYDTLATLIRRLMSMTKCYLRPEAGLAFKVVYPQAGDAVKETYYSNQTHYFKRFSERLGLAIPNHILVNWGWDDTTGTWDSDASGLGEAVDSAAINAYGFDIVEVFLASEVDNLTDANTRADVILSRIQFEASQAGMLVPHDCSVELFDRIQVVDNRGGSQRTYPTVTTARVTGLVHKYSPGIYDLEIALGGYRSDWGTMRPGAASKRVEEMWDWKDYIKKTQEGFKRGTVTEWEWYIAWLNMPPALRPALGLERVPAEEVAYWDEMMKAMGPPAPPPSAGAGGISVPPSGIVGPVVNPWQPPTLPPEEEPGWPWEGF